MAGKAAGFACGMLPVGSAEVAGAGRGVGLLSIDARASAGEMVTRGGSTYERMNHTMVQKDPSTAKIANPNASTFVPTLARRSFSLSPNVIVDNPMTQLAEG
jgi:hypothetical protein